jgi:hypothetical protein
MTGFVVLSAACGDTDSGPRLPLPSDTAMGFAIEKYTDHDVYEGELSRLKSQYPANFDYHTDRRSYDGGYPLYWITVGDTSKPAIFFVSVLHANREWAGTQIVLHFAEKLLDPEDDQLEFNRAFLSNYSLVAVPMANPWAYFGSEEGRHYNAHSAKVPGIETATWHDMKEYAVYRGVDLNRNFDWNWEKFQNLPWSIKSYWNGRDYGTANHYMMPYYLDEDRNEIYSPRGEHTNRILKPHPDVYDYKGSAPFSEPETQLIRDLVTERYLVVGFADWHTMNPWQTKNVSYISRNDPNRELARQLVDDAIRRVNERNETGTESIPTCKHIVMEEYGNNAPYSVNWAQNAAGIRSFGWESGTKLPDEVWTDAYMEIFYRSIYLMTAKGETVKPGPRES